MLEEQAAEVEPAAVPAEEAQEAQEQEAQPETEPEAAKTPEQIEADKEQEVHRKNQEFAAKRVKEKQRLRDAELKAARLEGELAAVEKFGLKRSEQAAQVQPETVPNPDNFQTTAEYVAAMSEFSAKKAIRDYEASTQRKTQEAEQRKVAESAATVRSKFIEAGKAEFGDDFEDEVINNADVSITPVMAAALYESEAGHLVSKHLADNPKESERISSLSPAGQIRELITLESKIMAAKQPRTSNTPPPIKPIKGGAQVDVDTSKMSDDEWFKWRQKQKQEARKGRV